MSTLEPIFDDDNLLVLNKPAGIPVLADRHASGCLFDTLRAEWRPAKPYLVHRIDKATSGCLIVARNQPAQSRMTGLFAANRVGKFYLAWVCGTPPGTGTQTIDLPLKKGRKNRYRIDGQRADITYARDRWFLPGRNQPRYPSCTRFRCVTQASGYSLLVVQPLTGRSHQIRVHLAWLGFPIVGDPIYGSPRADLQRSHRMHLHCRTLRIAAHRFHAPAPSDFVPSNATRPA